MKTVRTYDGEITASTNWAGDASTNFLPVKGSVIQNYIKKRFEKPIKLYYDQTGKAYRIFASEEDFLLWLRRDEDPDNAEMYDKLELANFIAPSPYDIHVYSYGSNIEPFDTTGRYIRYGVSNADTKVRFSWNITQDEDNYPDSMLITYTIKNASEQKIILRYSQKQKNVEFDLYDYLSPGTNTITLDFQGEQSKATKSISFTIDAIVLKLSTEFPYQNRFSSNTPYSFLVNLDSTGNAAKTILYWVDDDVEGTNLLGANHIVESAVSNYRSQHTINFGELSEGMHKIQFLASITVNGQTFCSNLLYYEFVVPENISAVKDYVVTEQSFDNVVEAGRLNGYVLYADQYKPFSLNWAYLSNSLIASLEDVSWSLIRVSKSDSSEMSSVGYTYKDTLKSIVQLLLLIPDIASTEDYDCILRVLAGDSEPQDYPIIVTPSRYNVTETGDYVLKLSGIGKQNNDHTWVSGTYTTSFLNFTWDNKSGWVNNALQLAEGTRAVVDFAPFAERDKAIRSYGRTFEIEFEFSSIGDSSETLVSVGDCVGGLGIKITPNEASFVYAGTDILTTNYKENERIKLAFIMQPQTATNSVDNALLWIVNNGILERCTSNDAIINANNNGKIVLGSTTSKSKLAVYRIRCYDNAISYDQAFNNFAFDSSNINAVLQRNDVFDEYGNLDYELVKTKIDTILITGQLDLILNMRGGTGDRRKEVLIPVTLERICLADDSYSFTIKNCRIRAHGQSTLNYPIPSFKIWSDSEFNCNVGGATPNTGVPTEEQIVPGRAYKPVMYRGTGLSDSDFKPENEIYKGRYSFKAGAIPSKKWVLQANYADSSCAHNGGIQRLILSTWYNAVVDNEYVLRSEPQQFATNSGSFKSTGWSSRFPSVDFPYELRNSSDSLPCVVFYRRTKESAPVFVGLFVLMDDKKADYVYGERSIYAVSRDPFCMLESNADKDTSDNRIWDNANVLRFEQTSANNEFASFSSLVKDGKQFDGVTGYTDADHYTYNWEEDFELIYPEKEDITTKVGGVKQYDDAKFRQKVQPFMNFYKWLVATKTQYNQATDWWQAGTYDTAQAAFEATAADHLDLYKIAAYYVFLLRFGLVDSLERNALLKTYDGQHWHFEPWDMDIALGNNNQGQITFDPPINRNTTWGSGANASYAYTGKSSLTSNWLYDALEAWHTTANVVNGQTQYTTGFLGTNSIVSKTAAALYAAGLTYANAVDMLDNEYSNKWCERIYNYSGHYKYIENGGSDYYTWLQGSRTTHRHWWLKSSFDYWDAEWGVGSFLTNAIYMALDANAGQEIRLVPSTETYFGVAFEYTSAISDKQKLSKDANGVFALRLASSTKVPLYLLGASYIKELDVSDVSDKMSVLNLSGCYDSAVGSNLKSLNIGRPVSAMIDGVFNDRPFIISINTAVDETTGAVEEDAGLGAIANVLKEVEYFNMLGYIGTTVQQNATKWLGAMENLKDFRSIGSTYTVFPGIAKGTTYTTLQLPSTVASITLNNAVWLQANSLDTNPNTSTGFSIWTLNDSDQNNVHFEQVGDSYYANTLKVLNMPGNTGQNACSLALVKRIIDAYKTVWGANYRTKLGDVTLEIEKILWDGFGENNPTYLTYQDLLDLAAFNGGNPQTAPQSFVGTSKLQGYVIMEYENISDEVLTQRFATLQNLFGPSIFNKNSSGLTIDYNRNTIVLTVGTKQEYNDTFSYANGYYTIQEGYFANGDPYEFPLTATKFLLDNVAREAVWTLYRIENGNPIQINGQWNGICLRYYGGTEYLVVPELSNVQGSNITTPQEFQIGVSINGETKTATVKVVPKRYPTSDTISCIEDPDGDNITVPNVNGFVISDDLTTYLFISELLYSGSLQNATVANSEWILTLPEGCPIVIDSRSTNNVTLHLSRTIAANEVYNATLQHKVTFKSGTLISSTATIKVQYDPVVLIGGVNGNEALYQTMLSAYRTYTGNQNWVPQKANQFKKSEINQFGGSITAVAGLSSYMCTVNGVDHWLFDYTTNITSFDINQQARTWQNTPIYKTVTIAESTNSGSDVVYNYDNFGQTFVDATRLLTETVSAVYIGPIAASMLNASVMQNEHLVLDVPEAHGNQVTMFITTGVDSTTGDVTYYTKQITVPYQLTQTDKIALRNCGDSGVAYLYHTASGSSSPLNGHKAYLFDEKGLNLSTMPHLIYFGVNGTGNVYASNAMPNLTEMCLGSVTYFDDTNFTGLRYLYVLRGSMGISGEYSQITDLKFTQCVQESSSKNHRWWNVGRLLNGVNNLNQIKNLIVDADTTKQGKFDGSDNDHVVTQESFEKLVVIARHGKATNSGVHCELAGSIHVPAISRDELDWFGENYPDLQITYTNLKLSFVDPYAEMLSKMAYAGKNGNVDLPSVITEDMVKTIYQAEIGYHARYWATTDFSGNSPSALSSGNYKTVTVNNETISGVNVASRVVHFPEARYFNRGGFGTNSNQLYFQQDVLQSYIIKWDGDPETTDGNHVGLGTRAIKSSSLTHAAYVDYSKFTAFYKYDHTFNSCDGFVVFWAPFYGEESSNRPSTNAYVLIPSYLADVTNSTLGLNGRLTSSHTILVFDIDAFGAEKADHQLWLMELWNRFYDTYSTTEGTSAQKLAATKAAFMAMTNNSATSNIYTISSWLAKTSSQGSE